MENIIFHDILLSSISSLIKSYQRLADISVINQADTPVVCGHVLCSPNHTFVSHPMISEHWDERSRRNLEASAPTKARSEPTDRASERLRCPLCVRRTFVFHVPELACTLCRKWSHERRRIVFATGTAVCNHLGRSGYLRRTLYTLRASPVPCAAVTEHT